MTRSPIVALTALVLSPGCAFAGGVQVFAGVVVSIHPGSPRPLGLGLNLDTSALPVSGPVSPDLGTFARIRWTGLEYTTVSAGLRGGVHIPFGNGGGPTYFPGFGVDAEYGWSHSRHGNSPVAGASLDGIAFSVRYSQLLRPGTPAPTTAAPEELPAWRDRATNFERTLDIEVRAGAPGSYWIDGRPMRTECGVALPRVAVHRPGLAASPASRAWLQAARDEHGAVHAFAQLARELQALGAPRRLVARARQAVAEEAGHAALCYGMAAELTGRPVVVAPLRPTRRPLGTRTAALTRIALESLVDGELGEGGAAKRAAAEARTSSSHRARAIKTLIAREEATHAELGTQLVAWCRREGGATVREALHCAERRLC